MISHNNGYILNGKDRVEWIEKQKNMRKSTEMEDKCSTECKDKFEKDFIESIGKYAAVIGCNEYLEIPREVGQRTNKYRSTRGHKINHSFTGQNSEYMLYDSAQFGIVIAIKTLNKSIILK